MATEKDVLVSLDTDTVIDRVAEKSGSMKKLLLINKYICVKLLNLIKCFDRKYA